MYSRYVLLRILESCLMKYFKPFQFDCRSKFFGFVKAATPRPWKVICVQCSESHNDKFQSLIIVEIIEFDLAACAIWGAPFLSWLCWLPFEPMISQLSSFVLTWHTVSVSFVKSLGKSKRRYPLCTPSLEQSAPRFPRSVHLMSHLPEFATFTMFEANRMISKNYKK